MLDGQGYDISCDLVMKVSVARADHRPLTNNTNYKYKDGNQPCS